MVQDVKITQEQFLHHHLYIGGKEVSAHDIFLSLSPNELPEIHVVANPRQIDFSGKANVTFDYEPANVYDAVVILRDALRSDSALRKGFTSSIRTALEDIHNSSADITNDYEAAEMILNRIIGDS